MWRVNMEWKAGRMQMWQQTEVFLITFFQVFQKLKSAKADFKLTSLLPGILSCAAVLNYTMSYIMKLHMKRKQRHFSLFFSS